MLYSVRLVLGVWSEMLYSVLDWWADIGRK